MSLILIKFESEFYARNDCLNRLTQFMITEIIFFSFLLGSKSTTEINNSFYNLIDDEPIKIDDFSILFQFYGRG